MKAYTGQGFSDPSNNIDIWANEVRIGKGVTFGKNIDIVCKGIFEIGDYSHLGDNCHMRGRNIIIGKHLFNSGGMKVGGGGRMNPTSTLTIGDRNTSHKCFINIDQSVLIGDDVGFSPEVKILTHGAWQSPLDGFPTNYGSVEIGDNTWLGYGVIVQAGVRIGRNCIVGSCSLVTRDIGAGTKGAIYGGIPSKFIKEIQQPLLEEKIYIVQEIIDGYKTIALYHSVDVRRMEYNFPFIKFNDCIIDINSLTLIGYEDNYTDDFRDYLRRNGIKIYTERPFKSNFTFREIS